MKQVIAVLDIGKTNKKVALFDEKMQMLDTRRRRIDSIPQEGVQAEDVLSIEEWFLDALADLSTLYRIRAIAVTTHGAASVCVDEEGNPIVPPVDYTFPVEESVHERFFRTMGSAEELQVETATAEVRPLINVGKALFFLRETFPERFSRIRHVLMYPQYFTYRLTGIASADITYTGCHSYLWDFHASTWSTVVDKLGIRSALPEKPLLSTEVLGTISAAVADRTGLERDVIVTAGIHDSNASLLPYLITRERDFVLNSTGTWCVAMHPEKSVAFTPDEVGKMVFYNLSYAGRPVKTSILMGGLEYENYRRILSERHARNDDPAINPALLAEIVQQADTFVLPSIVPGTGQFPDSPARVVEGSSAIPFSEIESGKAFPGAFEDYERALALVDVSVAIQTVVALERVGLRKGTEVFIEGGFRNNRSYLAILTALLPDNPVALTSVEEATSFGAALCARAALEGRPVEALADTVQMAVQPVERLDLPGIGDYQKRFLELVAG
ncbi:MAG: carbohydrate kinase [Spirochaetaceae bacterium]|nr:MAG: carbohydrate kinase [Spirochaetaceae bacterium]